jgi:spore coat protein U-like protein
MKLKKTHIASALCAMLIAGAAMADTATIEVTASISEACSVGNGTAIALGAMDMIDSNGGQATSDSVMSTTFAAICTNGTTAPKFSYASANEDGGNFRLKGDTDDEVFITYTLHQDTDASGSAVTADTEGDHPDFTADGTAQDLPLSVKVTSTDRAGKLAQSYADTITVTVSFGDGD